MTSDDDDYQAPGVAPCHGCGQSVLFAVPDGSDEVLALDPNDRGLIAAWEDDSGTARCRRVKATHQLALGEFLFRFHDATCPAIARPRPISSAKSLRPARPVTPATPRRAAR